jgi:RND family efflux transporter MFP subunit
MTQTSRIKIILTVAAGLFLLAAVLMIIQGQQPTVSAPDTERDSAHSAAHQVQVLKVQRRDISQTLTLPANISPWYQATLYGKVSGYVKWIGFDKGDVVKKGELLAVLDAPEIEDQYQQADADYQIKKVTYERYLSVWQDNHDIIAKQDVDVAKAAAESAKHQRDSRRTLMEYTKVYAPFSGVITARFADPGALIQSATGSSTQAAPLFTIMDMDSVRIYVNAPQEASQLAKPGLAEQRPSATARDVRQCGAPSAAPSECTGDSSRRSCSEQQRTRQSGVRDRFRQSQTCSRKNRH